MTERSQSVISQGVSGSVNARTSGVTSALCVRSSDLTKNIAPGTSKKGVSKKISNAHAMTSAGSGSESATMIKAFAQKLGPASSLIATSEASASQRIGNASNNFNTIQPIDDINSLPSSAPGARLSYPKNYNQMMQQTLQQKNSGRFQTLALSEHAARIHGANQLIAGG